MAKHQPASVRNRFAERLALPDEQINLAEAALLIAAEEYPRLNVAAYLDKLDRIADLARDRIPLGVSASDYITAINATLFDDYGFHGNRDNYYDPRNSFLNEVIDRRLGIPITLSVIYMEVARRVGFAVEGVGLPGHFIVRHQGAAETIYIDPFNRGRVLGEMACAELVAEISGGKTELLPAHLSPVTRRQILMRMLSNLLSIYARSDHRRALAVIERILIIQPTSAAHVRDHGLLLALVGQTAKALATLELYLKMAPTAADVDLVREQIKTIKQESAKLN
ncbi:MAG TPA: transglutaminase-like domain-containing protein [Blastocatellia bacterium]|nr:transglutaminase-like domain-containing protein [Blastocatellia bacterium]